MMYAISFGVGFLSGVIVANLVITAVYLFRDRISSSISHVRKEILQEKAEFLGSEEENYGN